MASLPLVRKPQVNLVWLTVQDADGQIEHYPTYYVTTEHHDNIRQYE